MALAQTLQFAWFGGHCILLLSALRYGLSYITFHYNSKWAVFTYRTAFLSAAATYGIVVYKAYRARARQGKQGSPVTLLADENVQYLIMASIWLFSRQIPLAILPFLVYSTFHVLTYVRANLIPTITPPQAAAQPGGKPKQSALADSIGRFVKEYYDSSMTLVALLEIALWFRVLGSALLFKKGSWILFALYTVFFRARYSQSSFVQGAVSHATARVDGLLGQQNMPPAVRQGWETAKGLVRQAADATDIQKYVAGSQAQGAPKKTQ